MSFDSVQGALTAPGRPAGFSLRDADGTEIPLIYKTVLDGPDAVLKLNEDPSPLGLHLWYGYGLYPYCNITDTGGASIPAFGPVAGNNEMASLPDDAWVRARRRVRTGNFTARNRRPPRSSGAAKSSVGAMRPCQNCFRLMRIALLERSKLG